MAVTPAEIATALGRTAPVDGSTEFDQWSLWIDDATLLITAEAARRDKTLTDLDASVVDYVTREAVVAQVKRPDDATTVDISVDDARTSRTYKSGKGRVVILAEWWELLFPTKADTSKAFAVDTVPGCGSAHLPWCSLSMGATSCSCGADIAGEPIYGDYL